MTDTPNQTAAIEKREEWPTWTCQICMKATPRECAQIVPYAGWRVWEIEITSGEHGISFNIDDEAAAGSYNIGVSASCRLLRSEAERLRDWLIEVLS